MRSGRWVYVMALLLVAAATLWRQAQCKAGVVSQTYSLTAAGHAWNVSAHIPASYDSARPTPLVLILHGAGGQGSQYLDKAGWARKSDQAGFIAIAPDGLPARPNLPANFLSNPRLWHTDQIGALTPRARIDDVVFFRALLDDAQRRWNIDRDRVYVAGHSNGAGMTFLLATALSDRIAAIAPVASNCPANPSVPHPMPTLFIIGTEDKLVPIAGGESTLPWGSRTTQPIAETLTAWAKALGCTQPARTTSDKGGVKLVDYGPGKGGVDSRVCFITGQGHGWPGGDMLLPARMVGPSVKTVNATDMIWDFFRTHPRTKAD